MRKKHILIVGFALLILGLVNYVALGDIVGGLETNEAAPPSVETEASRGILPISPTAIVENFDDVGAPCLFMDTVALLFKFPSMPAIYLGASGPPNGGAILNECSNFDVTGHSPPNFLAFNADATLEDGGIPSLPEILWFAWAPVLAVQVNAGVGTGITGPVAMIALDANLTVVGGDAIMVASQLQTLRVQAPRITFVVFLDLGLSTPSLVLDDLAIEF